MNYAAYTIFAVLALLSCGVLSHWLRKSAWPRWVFHAIWAGEIAALLGVFGAMESTVPTRVITIIAFAVLLHLAGVLVAVHFSARRVIAEQREGLSTLEIEHAVIEEIVNSIDAIVWEWDVTAHRFTFVSSQAERILGYAVEEWLANAELWRLLLHADDRWADHHFDQLIQGGHPYMLDYRMIARDGHTVWIRETGLICHSLGADGHQLVRGCLRDISTEKKSEIELQIALEKLVENSRRAGMAEVASGVLHNVGNVLNSVNVSSNLIVDRVKNSRVSDLLRVTELIHENRARLPEFFATDSRGEILPELLNAIARQLVVEHGGLLEEIAQIHDRIGHIKDIVSVQQDRARIGGFVEPSDLVRLVENALKFNEQLLHRARVQVIRDYDNALARTLLDGHLVLQILVTLIRNAIEAIEGAAPAEPRITVAVRLAGTGTTLSVSVADNGIGVAAENRERIFGHGYTTKRHGHGFGLHSGAIAAATMGGRLTVESAGLGHGSTFILEIPIDPTVTEKPEFWRTAGTYTTA